jgi:hypothetical protein
VAQSSSRPYKSFHKSRHQSRHKSRHKVSPQSLAIKSCHKVSPQSLAASFATSLATSLATVNTGHGATTCADRPTADLSIPRRAPPPPPSQHSPATCNQATRAPGRYNMHRPIAKPVPLGAGLPPPHTQPPPRQPSTTTTSQHNLVPRASCLVPRANTATTTTAKGKHNRTTATTIYNHDKPTQPRASCLVPRASCLAPTPPQPPPSRDIQPTSGNRDSIRDKPAHEWQFGP